MTKTRHHTRLLCHRHLPRHLPSLATSPLLGILSSPLIAFRPPKPPFRRTNRAFQPFSPTITAFHRTNTFLSSFQSAFAKEESSISLTDTPLFFLSSSLIQKPFNGIHDMYCLIIDHHIASFAHTYKRKVPKILQVNVTN